ncbi:hypothetical protein HN954_02215 [bacterium]|jgi:hypothetical protein|nr:hypothetical protein [bacterium]MBT6832286.1 hypothetical protein [bacterium]MBT6996223.1 hypothetical protein [bacterium]MBT7772470.1 hypothetical protein [bacterium]
MNKLPRKERNEVLKSFVEKLKEITVTTKNGGDKPLKNTREIKGLTQAALKNSNSTGKISIAQGIDSLAAKLATVSSIKKAENPAEVRRIILEILKNSIEEKSSFSVEKETIPVKRTLRKTRQQEGEKPKITELRGEIQHIVWKLVEKLDLENTENSENVPTKNLPLEKQ